jgi:hypothetical protein
MRLLRLDQFEFEPSDFICRERRAGRWIKAILFLVLALVFFFVSRTSDSVNRLGLLTSFASLAYALSFTPVLIRGLRTDPWVMCVRQAGLALNLRSYWNADRSVEDAVVAWFDWKEIRRAGEHRVSLRLPDPDHWCDRRFREAHLDLELNPAQTEELRLALEREFARGDRGRIHYFAPTVRLLSVDRLRIGWKDEGHALGPDLGEVLDRLIPYVPLRERTEAAVDWRTLGPKEFDGLLNELFRGGHHDQVVRLLRKARKWPKKQAEKFVEELEVRTADS